MLLRRNGGGLEAKTGRIGPETFFIKYQIHRYTNTNTEMEEAIRKRKSRPREKFYPGSGLIIFIFWGCKETSVEDESKV